MANFSNELITRVWKKASPVEGYNPEKYRKDVCGAWIAFDKYGMRDHNLGWEVDHVYPQSLIDTERKEPDLFMNLRPMHWENNRSKGDNFPDYYAAITSEGTRNVPSTAKFTINSELVESLNKYYNE